MPPTMTGMRDGRARKRMEKGVGGVCPLPPRPGLPRKTGRRRGPGGNDALKTLGNRPY
jgi:hypothetical protein